MRPILDSVPMLVKFQPILRFEINPWATAGDYGPEKGMVIYLTTKNNF